MVVVPITGPDSVRNLEIVAPGPKCINLRPDRGFGRPFDVLRDIARAVSREGTLRARRKFFESVRCETAR